MADEIVIWGQGKWSSFAHQTVSRDVSVAEVLSLMGHSAYVGEFSKPIPENFLNRLEVDEIHPRWAFAGMIASGRLLVESSSGQLHQLDANCVSVIDQLKSPSCFAELIETTRLEIVDLRNSIYSLVKAEIVVLVPSGSAEGGKKPDEIQGSDRVGGEGAGTYSDQVMSTRQGKTFWQRLKGVSEGWSSRLPSTGLSPIDQRVTVLAPFRPSIGVQSALPLITVNTRSRIEKSLPGRFNVKAPEPMDVILQRIKKEGGSHIFLMSDYIWTVEANNEFISKVRKTHPASVFIRGGPSSPKYERDARRQLTGVSDTVLVRGEGEISVSEVLAALLVKDEVRITEKLSQIGGIAFWDSEHGNLVFTPDRPRIKDLEEIISPFASGEWEAIGEENWPHIVAIETNRGCPYKCTFCDWGSATQTPVRKFDLDRVKRDFNVAAGIGQAVYVADANFGMFERDVEIAQAIGDAKREGGKFDVLMFTPAKNTIKHLAAILRIFAEANLEFEAAVSFQSLDKEVLSAVNRSNIRSDKAIEYASQLRSLGLTVTGELMLGLPRQSIDNCESDLQFLFDHDIVPRIWPTVMLPNSPMNSPEYRERWGIEIGQNGIAIPRMTISLEEYHAISRFAYLFILCDRVGILRHVLLYLQWDWGLPAGTVVRRLSEAIEESPAKYPLFGFVKDQLHRFGIIPVGPRALYRELKTAIESLFPEVAGDELDAVFEVQRFLLPYFGRRFPDSLDLPYDYQSYYFNNIRSLQRGGGVTANNRALSSFGPGTVTVAGDPMGLSGGSVWSALGDTGFQDQTMFLEESDDGTHKFFTAVQLLGPQLLALNSPLARASAESVGMADG